MVARPFVKSHKRQLTAQLDPDQALDLDRLVIVRRTNRSTLLRAAVDLFLAVNRSEIPTDLDPYTGIYGNGNSE